MELSEGSLRARGEAGGHPQLEPIEEARERVLAMRPEIERGLSRQELLDSMPRGPARKALLRRM